MGWLTWLYGSKEVKTESPTGRLLTPQPPEPWTLPAPIPRRRFPGALTAPPAPPTPTLMEADYSALEARIVARLGEEVVVDRDLSSQEREVLLDLILGTKRPNSS